MMKIALWILISTVVVLGGYIRLAPSDPTRWHMVSRGADRDMNNGVVRVFEIGSGGLTGLDAIARGTARTRVLAGSVEEGMVTYVTRTRMLGFPDYTTVQQEGDVLRIYARSRFGRKDFGVNLRRIDGWLALLKP